MMFAALVLLAVALTASIWTTAYTLTDAVPSLLWLDRMHREPSWSALVLADRMSDQLDAVIVLDNRERLAQAPRGDTDGESNVPYCCGLCGDGEDYGSAAALYAHIATAHPGS